MEFCSNIPATQRGRSHKYYNRQRNKNKLQAVSQEEICHAYCSVLSMAPIMSALFIAAGRSTIVRNAQAASRPYTEHPIR